VNEIIDHTAKRYDVDPLLVHSVIWLKAAISTLSLPALRDDATDYPPPEASAKNPFDEKRTLKRCSPFKQLQTTQTIAFAPSHTRRSRWLRNGTIPPRKPELRLPGGKRFECTAQQNSGWCCNQNEPVVKKIEQYVDSKEGSSAPLRIRSLYAPKGRGYYNGCNHRCSDACYR
jgi:hypothetical protein